MQTTPWTTALQSEILDTSTHIFGDQIDHFKIKSVVVVEWSKSQDIILNGKNVKI